MGKHHWKVEKQPEWYVKAVRKTIAALPGGYAEAADWLDVTENALFNRLRADGDQIFPLGWAMVLQRAAGNHHIADTRAWTYRHWMGTGTVGVMIASSDLINPIPEESTETAARQHIEPLAPVAGSDLYVFRPVAHKVDFHIRVTPDTPEIRAAITAELRSFLLRDGYPQGELKVSRISEAISGANGEYSHQLLAPADNISIAKNELAVLGTISWT